MVFNFYFSHLQPMLRDAIQKDGRNVKGPLTWSEFVRVGDNRLFNKATDLPPLPVPQIQLGTGGHELVQVAPDSIHHWDTIGLEPAAQRRDVYYMALVPESAFVSSKIKR